MAWSLSGQDGYAWTILHGHTQKTLLHQINDNTEGSLPIVYIERRSTARESHSVFINYVSKAVNTGYFDGRPLPPTALFQMPDIGIVVRDDCGKKVMGHDSMWHLWAQADKQEFINVWAVHHLGNHVAMSRLPTDMSRVVFNEYDTQKFTFKSGDTNTHITPNMYNMDIDYEVIFLSLEEGGGKETKVKIEKNATMRIIITEYAQREGTDIKSLRFSYAGKPMFMSTIGKKLPAQLGIVNLDVILVSYTNSPVDEDIYSNSISKKNAKKSSNKKAKKKGKGGGNKKKTGPRPVIELKMSDKEMHSKAFSLVLREAELTFKTIRQKLNSLALKRTLPKQRSTSVEKSPSKPQDELLCNPSSETESNAKAGKPYYLLQVGEVSNLYKSTKGVSRQKQRTRSLDLHGLRRNEALAKLDEQLVKWVDIAMRSEYPFVIRVAVVCGGGNQVLSETVEKWVKSNDTVANAPKNHSD